MEAKRPNVWYPYIYLAPSGIMAGHPTKELNRQAIGNQYASNMQSISNILFYVIGNTNTCMYMYIYIYI